MFVLDFQKLAERGIDFSIDREKSVLNSTDEEMKIVFHASALRGGTGPRMFNPKFVEQASDRFGHETVDRALDDAAHEVDKALVKSVLLG